MSRLFSRAIAPLLCLACLGVSATADPSDKKSTRHDALGDPLPVGALARLGTTRLVHLRHVAAVAVSRDGKLAASGTYAGNGMPVFMSGQDQSEPGRWVQVNAVRLWDTRTGKLLRELRTPDAGTSCLAFGADSSELFGACGEVLYCWNPATGTLNWKTKAGGGTSPTLPVSKMVLTADRLITVHAGHIQYSFQRTNSSNSGSHNQMAVRVWDRKTGSPRAVPPVLESSGQVGEAIPNVFHNLAVSADGRLAAVIASPAYPPRSWLHPAKGTKGAGSDPWQYPNPRLRIIDVATGAIRDDFSAANGLHAQMAFAPDASMLVIATGKYGKHDFGPVPPCKELWLLDVASARKRLLARNLPPAQQLMFVGGNRRVAARFDSSPPRVWDCATGHAVDPHRVHEHHFYASNGSPVVAMSHNNTIRLVDRDSGKDLHDFGAHRISSVHFGPHVTTPFVHFGIAQRELLVSRDWEQICFWEAGTWRPISRMPGTLSYLLSFWAQAQGITEMDVSAEAGLRLKRSEAAITIHDIRTDAHVRTFEKSASNQYGICWFSENGARVASQEEKQLVFFDVGTGKRLAAIDHPQQWPNFGASCLPIMSSMGKMVATSKTAKEIDLYQVDTGKRLRQLFADNDRGPNRRFATLQLRFSPDEQFLFGEVHRQIDASLNESVEVVVWNVHTGAIVQELVIVPSMQVWHRSSLQIQTLRALAMSPDRRLIALARNDQKNVEIWDTASGTKRAEFAGHEGPVGDVAFSGDGRYLASASDDTTILIWDLRRPLHTVDFKNEPTDAELTASWRALAERDAAKADAAIWRMVKADRPAVVFLTARLKPARRPDPVRVRRLVDDLDSEKFETRAAAAAELASYRELVVGELKGALAQSRSLEQKRRVQALLGHAQRATLPFGTPERVREWRALEVLERIDTPEATALVRTLAAGAPDSPLTIAANEVLTRLRGAAK